MRYASIRDLDISNGEGLGIALFVQGCHRHCYNCFNQETWDFNGGKEWTDETQQKFIQLLENRPRIKRLSILGGEPFEYPHEISSIIEAVSLKVDKVWIYTGYKYEELWENTNTRSLLFHCDVLVDGEYIDDLRDLKLKWRGSSNQRVIDVNRSIAENKVVLYCD